MNVLYTLLIIGIAFLIIAFIKFSKAPKEKSIMEALSEYLSKNNISSSYTKETNRPFDYFLKTDKLSYLIKIVKIPEFGELQINSKTTFEVKYGAGDKPGKVQPYRKYLTEIEEFMMMTPHENEQKLIIVAPKAKKIVKYINESEIIFVTKDIDVYGTKIINVNDYDLFLESNNANDQEKTIE